MVKNKTFLTWNIQFGTRNPHHPLVGETADLTTETTRLITIIPHSSGDSFKAIAFQEVDRFQPRSRLANQPASLFSATKNAGFQWAGYAPTFLGINFGIRLRPATYFPKPLQRLLPASGIFLALKHPPLKVEVSALGKSPLHWYSFTPAARRNKSIFNPLKYMGGKPIFGERRIALIATTPTSIYATTHLEVHATTARQQLLKLSKLLLNKVEKENKPAYLLGDLNLPLASVKDILEDVAHGKYLLEHTLSFPSPHPVKPLDYLIVFQPKQTKEHRIFKAEPLKSGFSDHLPILYQTNV